MKLLLRASLALGALVSSATSLLLTPDSPCSKHCGNVLSSTTAADMVCYDKPAQYGTTPAGNVFQNCITCQMTSPFFNGGQSDLQWLIYNMRYTLSFCLFGFPDNNLKIGSSPCITSKACEPLQVAIQWQNLTTLTGQYDFCRAWVGPQVPACGSCLGGNHPILRNFVVMLDAACAQLPPLGRTVAVSGNPFTTNAITAVEPTPTGYVFTPDNGPLNLGAKVGIAGAGVVLLLAVAGCGIVCNGKRRRRAYLRDLEKRHAQAQAQGLHGEPRWPGRGLDTAHDSPGGADMYQTPVSTQALFSGSWETSPVSAHTDHNTVSTGLSPAVEHALNGGGPGSSSGGGFTGRYFSPYNSQYNSPVSAVETSAMMQWPAGATTAAWAAQGSPHERLAQLDRDQQLRTALAAGLIPPPPHHYQPQPQQHEIGLALGGDDPSLRSKRSEQSMQPSLAMSFADKKQISHEDGQQPYYTKDDEQIHYPPPPPGPPPPSQTWSPDTKGKSRDYEDYGWSSPQGGDVKSKHQQHEEFELHEVDSNGSLRIPVAPSRAPVLQHPGYGRHHPGPDATQQQWV